MSADIHSLADYVPDDELVLVPEGNYELAYQKHDTWLYMGRYPKVKITFRIFSFGEHHNKPLIAYYNPKKIMGKPKPKGKFSAGWRSRLMMDFATCFGAPARKDQIPMSKFEESIVIGKVRTVTHNKDQRKYPDGLEYSVVSELLGVKKL